MAFVLGAKSRINMAGVMQRAPNIEYWAINTNMAVQNTILAATGPSLVRSCRNCQSLASNRGTKNLMTIANVSTISMNPPTM